MRQGGDQGEQQRNHKKRKVADDCQDCEGQHLVVKGIQVLRKTRPDLFE